MKTALENYEELLNESIYKADCYMEACVNLMDVNLMYKAHRDYFEYYELQSDYNFLELYCNFHEQKYHKPFICN